MNELECRIKTLIEGKKGKKEKKTIKTSLFMQMALFDESAGYYQTQNPFGKSGDFITAPEASQIFGEIIGCYAVSKWIAAEKPQDFQIIELGPGNGTLLDDFLRATKNIFGFHDSIKINLIEISDRLKKIQLQKLEKYKIRIQHFSEFSVFVKFSEANQNQKSFIYANEFFDAIPIDQYYYDGKGLVFKRNCIR